MLSQGASDLGAPVPKVPRALAMQVPAVKRGRDLICGTLGGLAPRVIDSGNRTVPSELADQPETNFARVITWTNVVEDMLLEKHAWLRVTEVGADGYPSKVVRLEPTSVSVNREGRVYVNSRTGAAQGSTWDFVDDSELIRIDSPNDAVLTAGARAIRIALQLMATAGRYADDPGMFGFLTPKDGEEGPGTDKDAETMLDDFEDRRRRRSVVPGAAAAQRRARLRRAGALPRPRHRSRGVRRQHDVPHVREFGAASPGPDRLHAVRLRSVH
jgi:hypothetical protein